MAYFYLVRHAAHSVDPAILVGRTPGVRLSPQGCAQAQALGAFFAARPVHRLVSSPLERARETAEAMAGPLNLAPTEAPELMEIDFGDWTGRRVDQLRGDPAWERFNSWRSGAGIPGGEWMLDVQRRVVRFLLDQAAQAAAEAQVLVSHGDVIKAALLYFLGMPLDRHLTLQIGLGSVSELEVYAAGAAVHRMGQGVSSGKEEVGAEVSCGKDPVHQGGDFRSRE